MDNIVQILCMRRATTNNRMQISIWHTSSLALPSQLLCEYMEYHSSWREKTLHQLLMSPLTAKAIPQSKETCNVDHLLLFCTTPLTKVLSLEDKSLYQWTYPQTHATTCCMFDTVFRTFLRWWLCIFILKFQILSCLLAGICSKTNVTS